MCATKNKAKRKGVEFQQKKWKGGMMPQNVFRPKGLATIVCARVRAVCFLLFYSLVRES